MLYVVYRSYMDENGDETDSFNKTELNYDGRRL